MMRNLAVLVVSGVLVMLLFFALTAKKDAPPVFSPKLPSMFKKQLNDFSNSNAKVDTLMTNLKIPWEIVFLPDGKMLITQREGSVLLYDQSRQHRIDEVVHLGEGGLLGAAIDPDFNLNNYIYFYYTYRKDGELLNKVSRFVFENDKLSDETVILDDIKGYRFHDGGRIKFGPDMKLYITTGDAGVPGLSQNLDSLSGKILRINPDGSVPKDNPFPGSLVYSYGHRNPQGIAWDKNGALWATEHGQLAKDEVNQIEPGKNYGWPVIQGDEEKDGMKRPVIHSGAETWAPSGGVILNNKFYFAGLAGRSLFVFDLSNNELSKMYEGEWGRLRSVNLGPDGSLYILTNNLDGRNNNPSKEDDRLIKITFE